MDEQETQVELLLALVGDANLNGAIEQGDLDIVLNNWGLVRPSFQLNEGDLTAAVWALGDLNGNGRVEQGDLDAILNHWGGSAAPNFRGLNVPEPSAGLALLSCAALTRRRRRHIRVSRSRS